MKRIGIFGGSFNPIHNGHIALAHQLRQRAGIDEVWLMVSPQNPLKQGSDDMLDERLRFLIARIALHGEKGLVASDYELRLPRPSYTWNTLQHLKADYPHYIFDLLIGGDNWQLFPRWYRSSDILREHRVLVYPREGTTVPAPSPFSASPAASSAAVPAAFPVSRPSASATVPAASPAGLIIDAELLPISSTDIRRRVRKGESISTLVPKVTEPLVRTLYAP
jgi:nicotinate-nucleotide adenylyltransferase